MNTLDIIASQYLASLAMLEQTIRECPEAIWSCKSIISATSSSTPAS